MDVYFSTSTTRSGEQSEMGIQLANILHDQYIRVVDFKYPTHEGEGVNDVFGNGIMTGKFMC